MKIKAIDLTNYRSLKNVRLRDLGDVVVFFGDNDTGKSNVLSFLETLFKRRYRAEVTKIGKSEDFPEGTRVEHVPSAFWDGVLDEFSDNFHKNAADLITFDVQLEIRRQELSSDGRFPRSLLSAVYRKGGGRRLDVVGRISRLGPIQAQVSLESVTFGGVPLYDSSKTGVQRFLPGVQQVKPSSREAVFAALMGKLDDSFVRVPPNRFLAQEEEILGRERRVGLSAETFKNWLFQTSLDKSTEYVFREIRARFSSEPFQGGYLTLARVGQGALEIVIEDSRGVRLPIGRKGTGMQQVLLVLAFVENARNARFLGIEELETNLSPRAINSAMSMLKALLPTGTTMIEQLFLTTHSPKIASISEGVQRHFVALNGNGETEIRGADDPMVNDFYWPPE